MTRQHAFWRSVKTINIGNLHTSTIQKNQLKSSGDREVSYYSLASLGCNQTSQIQEDRLQMVS
jgi:hypothetical protein